MSNQKAMLGDYAEKNGFTGIRHFTNNGISGTIFERERLQSMLAEVGKGNIGTIMVKDMSRLGRNYVQMGMLREQLAAERGREDHAETVAAGDKDLAGGIRQHRQGAGKGSHRAGVCGSDQLQQEELGA